MTDPHDEYGEILRRALNAEAEKVTPAADGLEQIRRRIEERRRRRFSWDWFTAKWARPLLAVATAVAVAGLGVSAPQTLGFLSSSVGGNGASDDHEQTAQDGLTPGDPGAPPDTRVPTSSGTAPEATPSESASPAPPSASGSAACAPSTAPTDEPTASGTPAPQPPQGSCSTPPTSPTPPTEPPTDTSSPPHPGDNPTEQPEDPTSSESTPPSTDAPAGAPE
ncbi:hypothetical protein Arub01_10710 [Actinomadura rubrobrunea]|uniref:Uncharacterized protein n=1 Tax=Actinomadura rubrobrunea TaxID=115335 RepID=A0A9W6PSS4_9ACTN|nr:hypothetical protein [Actinomadura rubrobrunea]GLW62827.1 hypothetical protein Arub01_10710 [Actinomadura rubrobrunea]